MSGAALLLGACTTTPVEEPAAEQQTQASEPAPVRDSGLPIDATAEVPAGKDGWTECPYLDTQWVADTNGQRMTAVGVDERFDVPACVFWSYPARTSGGWPAADSCCCAAVRTSPNP